MLRLAQFHEDVDITGGFWEVEEPNNIRVDDFVSNFNLSLNPLFDVSLQLLLSLFITLLFLNPCCGMSTCMSSYCLDISLHANRWLGLVFSHAT